MRQVFHLNKNHRLSPLIMLQFNSNFKNKAPFRIPKANRRTEDNLNRKKARFLRPLKHRMNREQKHRERSLMKITKPLFSQAIMISHRSNLRQKNLVYSLVPWPSRDLQQTTLSSILIFKRNRLLVAR